jgi:hypothetical protein
MVGFSLKRSSMNYILFFLWISSCVCINLEHHQRHSGPHQHRPIFHQDKHDLNRYRPIHSSIRGHVMNLRGGGGLPLSAFREILKKMGGVASSALMVGGMNLVGFLITLGTGTHVVTDLFGTGAIGASAAISYLLNDGPTSCRFSPVNHDPSSTHAKPLDCASSTTYTVLLLAEQLAPPPTHSPTTAPPLSPRLFHLPPRAPLPPHPLPPAACR